jgi:hypothetical protein
MLTSPTAAVSNLVLGFTSCSKSPSSSTCGHSNRPQRAKYLLCMMRFSLYATCDQHCDHLKGSIVILLNLQPQQPDVT